MRRSASCHPRNKFWRARCDEGISLTIALAILALAAATELSAATPTAPAASVDSQTVAFFKEHCLRCHAPEKSKGDLRLDQLDADLSQPATAARWQEILARVQAGEMPPKKEPRPAAAAPPGIPERH